MLQSTFISYGGPDEAFAKKLQKALTDNGPKTWFFPNDAEVGEKIHRVTRRGIEDHDRVILICSETSLQRDGVLAEIEKTLSLEERRGGISLLIPVDLDGHVHAWAPERADLATALRERVVADFTDETQFDVSLGRLLAALKKSPTATTA